MCIRDRLLHDHNYKDVIALFVQRCPNTVSPSRHPVFKMNKNWFEQAGFVEDLPRSGRPTEENRVVVAQSFVQSPSKSTRKAFNEHGISRTSF